MLEFCFFRAPLKLYQLFLFSLINQSLSFSKLGPFLRGLQYFHFPNVCQMCGQEGMKSFKGGPLFTFFRFCQDMPPCSLKRRERKFTFLVKEVLFKFNKAFNIYINISSHLLVTAVAVWHVK